MRCSLDSRHCLKQGLMCFSGLRWTRFQGTPVFQLSFSFSAKHHLCFVSATITAGWRCSLTQFCHSNLGQPQHFQYYVYFSNSHHFSSWVREPFHVQLCWQNWGGSELQRGAERSRTGVPVAMTPGWPFLEAQNKQTWEEGTAHSSFLASWVFCPLLTTRIGGKYTDLEGNSQIHYVLAY